MCALTSAGDRYKVVLECTKGLGQTSCPCCVLRDLEHLGTQSITSEQKSMCQDKCSVKGSSCIYFPTTDCPSAWRHFSHNKFFWFESYKCFTVCMMSPSYLLTGSNQEEFVLQLALLLIVFFFVFVFFSSTYCWISHIRPENPFASLRWLFHRHFTKTGAKAILLLVLLKLFL